MGNKLAKAKKTIDNTDNIIIEPERLVGYISKQGHIIKSWKSRYFILDHGKLEYFVGNNPENDKGVKAKGILVISEYKVASPILPANEIKDTMLYLVRKDGKDPDLLLNFDDIKIRNEWELKILEHAKYYDSMKDEIQCWCKTPFANKASVACSYENCPIGWFHLKCVGLTPKDLQDHNFEFICYACKPHVGTICVCKSEPTPNKKTIKCALGDKCPVKVYHKFGCVSIVGDSKLWICPHCEGKIKHGDSGALLRVKEINNEIK